MSLAGSHIKAAASDAERGTYMVWQVYAVVPKPPGRRLFHVDRSLDRPISKFQWIRIMEI